MKNLNNLQKAILKAMLLFIILFSVTVATAQTNTYKIVGNEVVKVQEPKEAKAEPIKTQLTHTIKGIKYPVYKSAKGKYFIKRVSKTSGKKYNQYLKIEA